MTIRTPVSPLTSPAGDEGDSDEDREVMEALEKEDGKDEPGGKVVVEHDDDG